jgi:chaperonin cofactor prefoldin
METRSLQAGGGGTDSHLHDLRTRLESLEKQVETLRADVRSGAVEIHELRVLLELQP